jgi:hypothetical protein
VREEEFVVAGGFDPVKECETTRFGRFVRAVRCPNAELMFISRAPRSQEVLRNMNARLTRSGFGVEPRALRVNGVDVPTLWLRLGPEDKPRVTTLIAALDVPGASDSIEVQCFRRDDAIQPARCASLLEAFVKQGLLNGEWPRSLAQIDAHGPIHFDVAGRDLLLPGSCDELGLFDVECQEGHVQMTPLQSAPQIPHALSAELALTRDETLALERVIPCRVEGLQTDCVVRRYELPFGDMLHVYYAALEVRGVPLLFVCDTRQSRVTLLPGGMCQQFFSFAEGDLEEPYREEGAE